MGRRMVLDLGRVLVAAEVLVNDRSAGVRLARPFQFDLTELIRTGTNTLEVRVANTIAPHYTVTNRVQIGTHLRILGPVTFAQQLPLPEWKTSGRFEIGRLTQQLDTPTPSLVSAQRAWENRPRWQTLKPSTDGVDLRQAPETGAFCGQPQRASRSPLGISHEADRHYWLSMRVVLTRSRYQRNGCKLQAHIVNCRSQHDARTDSRFAGVTFELKFQVELSICTWLRCRFSTARAISLDRARRASPAPGDAVAGSRRRWQYQRIVGRKIGHPYAQSERSVVGIGPEYSPAGDRIAIFNRTDGDLENRLSGYRVTLLDDARHVVWQTADRGPHRPTAFSTCRPDRLNLFNHNCIGR